MTLDEAKAALERGRHVALVTPPAVEQAGELWELLPRETPGHGPGVGPPVLIICADDVSAAEWASAAPADFRVHAVTGLARSARLLTRRRVHVLAGAVSDLAALLARAALKLDAVRTIVIAWPEAFAGGEHAAVLDTLLGEAREARRIVLSWNPLLLRDFLERHARRAEVVGSPPVDDVGAPLAPLGPARYAVVPPSRRAATVREAIELLDLERPFVWEGGPIGPPDLSPDLAPDAVLCARLPSREQLAALMRFGGGAPALLVTAAQLPYLHSIAGPLTPLRLPSSADRAADRAAALRDQVARLITERRVDAELALLDPLFERFDPAEVAAALLAISYQPSAVSSPLPPPSAAWVKVFVNVGKKDRAAAKDLVGALIREVGIPKDAIGRVDVRETFSLIDVTPAVADRAVRGLSRVAIKGRRAVARLDRTA